VSGTPLLFIDGDEALVGTDSATGTSDLSNVRLQPGVIPALLAILRAGYRLVRVSDTGRPGEAPDFL
jgi:histidinol phosphatase-like enzyme